MSAEPARRTRDLGILALAFLGPIWGYGWVATKVALGYSDALTFAALRVPFSAACLFLVMIVLRRSLRPPPLGWTALIALFQTTLFIALVITALHDAGAGKVSVLTYTMPFWLLLLAWIFLGERLRGLQWFAVALALAGLVLVVRPWELGSATSGILALLGGVSWAVAALLVKLFQRRHTVDVLSLTTWQMTLGSVPLVIAAVLTYSGGPEWTFSFWWGLPTPSSSRTPWPGSSGCTRSTRSPPASPGWARWRSPSSAWSEPGSSSARCRRSSRASAWRSSSARWACSRPPGSSRRAVEPAASVAARSRTSGR